MGRKKLWSELAIFVPNIMSLSYLTRFTVTSQSREKIMFPLPPFPKIAEKTVLPVWLRPRRLILQESRQQLL